MVRNPDSPAEIAAAAAERLRAKLRHADEAAQCCQRAIARARATQDMLDRALWLSPARPVKGGGR